MEMVLFGGLVGLVGWALREIYKLRSNCIPTLQSRVDGLEHKIDDMQDDVKEILRKLED